MHRLEFISFWFAEAEAVNLTFAHSCCVNSVKLISHTDLISQR